MPQLRLVALNGQTNGTRPSLNGEAALDIPPNTVTESQSFTVLRSAARLENYQPHPHIPAPIAV